MEICLISVICHVANTLSRWWKTCYCITEILECNGGSNHRELAHLVSNVIRLIATVDAPHKGQIAPTVCLYHDVTMICIIWWVNKTDWPIYAPINWAIISWDNGFQVISLAICDLLLIGDLEYFSVQLEKKYGNPRKWTWKYLPHNILPLNDHLC